MWYEFINSHFHSENTFIHNLILSDRALFFFPAVKHLSPFPAACKTVRIQENLHLEKSISGCCDMNLEHGMQSTNYYKTQKLCNMHKTLSNKN